MKVVYGMVTAAKETNDSLASNTDKFRHQNWSVWNFLGLITSRCSGKESVFPARGHAGTRLERAAEIKPKNFSASRQVCQ